MGSDRKQLRYAYHKPFKVKFPDKCKWQNRYNPDNTGLAWCKDGSKTNKGADSVVYRRGQSFSLGHHTMVLQAEIDTIKAYIMENTEKGYTGRNIYILSQS
jgi:hypothetical protein